MIGKKLFDSIQEDTDLFGVVPTAPKRPGRDVELSLARNLKMAARLYYYVTYFPKVKYEVIMELMVQDFSISSVRIKEVLEEMEVELAKLKKARPGLEWFREQWPRIVWSEELPEFDKPRSSTGTPALKGGDISANQQ